MVVKEYGHESTLNLKVKQFNQYSVLTRFIRFLKNQFVRRSLDLRSGTCRTFMSSFLSKDRSDKDREFDHLLSELLLVKETKSQCVEQVIFADYFTSSIVLKR